MIKTAPVRPQDQPFLFQVYTSTRHEEVAAWGWAGAEQTAFLRMQFQAQQQSYALQYPGAESYIIYCDELPVGRLLIERTEQEILLIDIALLPDHRGRGLGGSVLRGLQAEATQAGKTVRLSVQKENRARRLYERMGFLLVGASDLHYVLAWRPPA